MTQKVVTVVLAPTSYDKARETIDFPEVSNLLIDGYIVKDLRTILTDNTPRARVTLVFILEKA